MSINSIINAEKYSEELDRVFSQKSVTGFFADNAMAAKFVGAKTVIIPDIDFQGLTDYDRNSGYSKGAISVKNTSYTMTMDRARSLQIDREDMDETGIANLAGKVLGEYVRTKVVPECDAYVISKLYSIANDRGNIIDADASTPIANLQDLINQVRGKVGFDEELVAFIDNSMYAHMQSSDELSKMITVSDFKQGDVNLTVRSFNGVALLPVVNERMKSEFNFADDENGGFKPTDAARDIYMLVCPKNAVHLVKKTENMRVFTPEQNVDADAYKFDYRIYYDAFVGKDGVDAIYAWPAPTITFTTKPESTEAPNTIGAFLSVSAKSTGEVTYQWYSCEDETGRNPKRILGQTSGSFEVGLDAPAGTYYYFARVYVDSLIYKDTDVVKVELYEPEL